ncbi:protein EARLY FLOWERING 4 [Malania oleifera]|uniref:protein EARLY FLOWERING 4 n=1 Tax=Malania oleifera TaxID=397392 RepID=UPI0025AEB5B2|nr:protein EARLY FLOWERING 4 [Malania oleifera]
MTTLDSSSAAESSMDDGSNGSHQPSRLHLHSADGRNGYGYGEDADGEGDAEVWDAFSKSFSQVQSVLDRNRVLIQQVNENHQSKIPDNLVKNVALIQELNGNISKVVSLYSDLSTNFSSMFHQRNGTVAGKNDDAKGA